MLDRILRFSATHPLLILIGVLLLVLAGLDAFRRLPIDAVPDVTNNQVQILTSAPALTPLEIERQVTFPIETALAGLTGVEEIRSLSKFGLSAVTVVFDDDMDIYRARQLVFERLAAARDQIPPGSGAPMLGPITTGLGEVYQYELRAAPGSGYDAMGLRTIQDWIVRRQLLGTPGVAEVNSYGGLSKQYQVRIEPSRLQAYGLTLREVMDAVVRNNANVSGGAIVHAQEQFLLRGVGLAQSVEDLARIVVATGRGGTPILVRDLGEVVCAPPAVRQGAVTADGAGETVCGIALMLKGANARTVTQNVAERLAEIAPTLPPGVHIVPFYDRAELVGRTIRTVIWNLTEGALIVIGVLVLLLGHWPSALLVATVIPLSMLGAAVGMQMLGLSGNLMSLGAIDFGLIVDGAVILTENSIRRVAEHQHALGRRLTTAERQEVVVAASSEVRRATMFGEIIIALVYVPLLALRGIEGKMFAPMALTVMCALASAAVLSLTYIPAMLVFVLRGSVAEHEVWLIRLAKRGYGPVFAWMRRQRAQATAVAFGLVLLSGALVMSLGAEFIPRLEEGALAVQIQRLPSVSVAEAVRTATEAERVLLEFPEVTKVVTKNGSAEIATDPMGIELGDIYIGLKPPAEWKTARTREELVAAMAAALRQRIPEARFSFSQPIELRVAELISGVKSDVAVKVFGDDLEVLRDRAERIAQVLTRIPGAADVKLETIAGIPQVQIVPNRPALARYGLSVEDVNLLVESLVVGREVGTVYEGERRFPLVVRLGETSTRRIEDIAAQVLLTPTGARVPLAAVAEVTLVEGPAQVSREHGRRRMVVECNVRGRDVAGFVAEARSKLKASVDLPPGYRLVFGGQFENLQRAAARLAVVVPVALLLIYALLYTSFGQARAAALVFTGVPFAAVGGVAALALRGMPFSISAGVGFIALFGVAVLNGLVLVSAMKQLRRQGLTLEAAVREGALTRVRPVLTTALVASLGFLPMATATSAGAEVQRPLATVVIGGLVTATLLTLLLLPALYEWVEQAADTPEGR
ncbi:efflux RND transporter permease subunit [Chloracidobacterium thermophilum]|uniref:Heavy metal efflux pump (Cobalt-zinc-cadmium) n=1 Tax=Chloracidobacterium thermophilum (strain B) TaxID=981222 RepID=G2LHT7_CHLTF|nr:CusA/CzcA family heavy metal efflux RND transporter [Chloracidobacterium thermophilum]AEP10997.1 heavy metal efflux pump (cobalt-zinc-cadmium) [Chloracidobacterium thermophilum B]